MRYFAKIPPFLSSVGASTLILVAFLVLDPNGSISSETWWVFISLTVVLNVFNALVIIANAYRESAEDRETW